MKNNQAVSTQHPKNVINFVAFLLVTVFIFGCFGGSKKVEKQGKEESVGLENVHLTPDELQELGVFIKDSAIMYNNRVEGVGSIDIVIRDTEYFGAIATTTATNFAFYPRYITTLDTIQRTAYMISEDHSQSEREAQKWKSFHDLIPIIVEQKVGDDFFGETLIFWMTKTPELEQKLKDIGYRQ